eukprot:PhF_6_TR22381/c0_g1_i3/m.31748
MSGCRYPGWVLCWLSTCMVILYLAFSPASHQPPDKTIISTATDHAYRDSSSIVFQPSQSPPSISSASTEEQSTISVSALNESSIPLFKAAKFALTAINIPRKQPLEKHPIFTCPRRLFPSMKSADGGSVREAIHKYTLYTRLYCNKTGMMQMYFSFNHYIYFLDIIAQVVHLKRGDVIMDWGSGCGTMLNYFHKVYNTTGIGLDATEEAVLYAKKHAADNQIFCHTDATRGMSHFKSNTFDAIVSWAALYHVRRTLQQCETVNEMVRVLKPGGIAFLCHLRTEKTQKFWSRHKCQLTNGSYVKAMDAKTFHVSSFKRNGFFSLVVTKNR